MSGATAKEIAKKLGISAASVSVALNGKPGVSDATRQRILAAAAEMGYSAPKAASDSRQLCFLIYYHSDLKRGYGEDDAEKGGPEKSAV